MPGKSIKPLKSLKIEKNLEKITKNQRIFATKSKIERIIYIEVKRKSIEKILEKIRKNP